MTCICRAGEFQLFAPGSPLPTCSNCPIWRPAHPRAHAVTWRSRQEAPSSALFPQPGPRFLSPSRSQIPPTSMKCRCRQEAFPDALLYSHAGHSLLIGGEGWSVWWRPHGERSIPEGSARPWGLTSTFWRLLNNGSKRVRADTPWPGPYPRGFFTRQTPV